jgi:hypothetical protein
MKIFIVRGKERLGVEIDYYLLTGRWPTGRRIFVFPRLCWQRLMRWSPSDSHARRIGACLELSGRMAHNAVMVATILVAIYIFAEIATAFLPGGPVQRVLGGGQ